MGATKEPVRTNNQHVFFIFCKKSQSRWSWLTFSRGYKHVYMLMSDGRNTWSYRPNGFNVVIEAVEEVGKLDYRGEPLCGKTLADYLHMVSGLEGVERIVGVEVEHDRGLNDLQPFLTLGLTCSELCRIASGVRVGRTFTPRSLHDKLMRLSMRSNFRVFYVAGGSHSRFFSSYEDIGGADYGRNI